ncbi:MAG: hypothetical protein CML61_12320 [Rhodobacteraceae bacterium]|nr:hypothetical protein [Paracoccaceae bacterium]|tara:strand:- start:93 stop:296 length:204 start_codon:yes stop_codon:yes gene_type:complete
MSEAFWVVKGNGPATFQHDTREQAEREAERLARQNPGRKFYVLETVCGFVKDDVRKFDLDVEPYNPF